VTDDAGGDSGFPNTPLSHRRDAMATPPHRRPHFVGPGRDTSARFHAGRDDTQAAASISQQVIQQVSPSGRCHKW
jgi:hypothetical protein